MAYAGIHHLALITNDMKAQLEFFTQVAGMKLVALFPMHGAGDVATHCFIEIGKDNYLSFVEIEGKKVEPVEGVSHAENAFGAVAGGAMQHVSFNVETIGELRNLRDRLRSNKYAVFGPVDHGMSQSIYVGAPEGILLEFSTSDTCPGLVPLSEWMNEDAAARIGVSPEDMARYASPPEFEGRDGAIEQPRGDDVVLPKVIARERFEKLGYLSDEEFKKVAGYASQKEESAA